MFHWRSEVLSKQTLKQTIKQPKLKDMRELKKTFAHVLKEFGFVKLDKSEWPCDGAVAYENKAKGWFAEIIDRKHYKDVWMVGNGLKTSAFPGGWVYDEPELLHKELSKTR